MHARTVIESMSRVYAWDGSFWIGDEYIERMQGNIVMNLIKLDWSGHGHAAANDESSEACGHLMPVTIKLNPSTRLDNATNFWRFVIGHAAAEEEEEE